MSYTASRKFDFMSYLLPQWPLLIWLVAIALGIGFVGGLNTPELIEQFNVGFGRALGDFALILLPSFTLAAAMERHNTGSASGLVAGTSPFAAAGMICPDTAYAALSPAAGRRRLDVAFGAYSGFKLLYPAGPLIVATGLGVPTDSLVFYSFALFIPVWAVGVLWVRLFGGSKESSQKSNTAIPFRSVLSMFGPFILLATLIVLGSVVTLSEYALLDFITQPKGALIVSAAVAMLSVPVTERPECFNTAISRTGALLLVIGIASAFGGILTHVVPLGAFISQETGIIGVISLFFLTAAFKLAQGSSMATFAAVAPVAAPLVDSMGIPDITAVFAICIGSFVAILPNDSFYWLVRRDAMSDEKESHAITILAGGATLQAFAGLGIIVLAISLGFI